MKTNLNKKLLQRLFVAASIRRWNDKATPLEFVELDKQAHKIIVAYILAKYEEDSGRNIDYIRLIEQFMFEFFERVVLTDIKPPVFHKLKETHGSELAKFVESKMQDELKGFDFSYNLGEYLANKKIATKHLSSDKSQNIESRILDAAHFFASKWEFDIIYNFNPNLYDIANIKNIIDSQNENFYDLKGMKNIILYKDICELMGMFAELRFQKRWSQTPRIPQTSVLGHMLIVAICAYLSSLECSVCKAMRVNHFFGGLFHDLPEVLTRDIISPIKRSVKGLDRLIKDIEKQEMQDKILKKLPQFISEDIIYWSESEFENRYKMNGEIVCGVESSALISKFNDDKFMPICGELLKFCDKLSAFLEARISIMHGVSSPDLIEGSRAIYEDLKDKIIFGIDFGAVLRDF